MRAHLARAQVKHKKFTDLNRTERAFQVGEQVLLKLQPYVQKSVASRPCPKLAFKFFGPFKILAQIGAVAYRLELPDGCQVHPVFHVSQLKAFNPSYAPTFQAMPPPQALLDSASRPLAILQRRMVQQGNAAAPQVLIQWSNLPEDCATWEDYYVLRQRFPDAAIWEGDRAQEGKDVMHSDP